MKLKLFKKYFFTTAIIIVFSLSVMLMILSFVLNNNIAASKQVVLTKACSEVVEYIGQVSEENEAADVKNFVNVLNTISDVSETDMFIADYPTGEVTLCGCGEYKRDGNCSHSAVIIAEEDMAKVSSETKKKFRLSNLNIYKRPRYVYSEPLYNKSGEQYGVVFATASVTTVQSLLADVTKLYIASASLPIIIMFFCIYAMVYRLTKPLKQMSEATRAMAKGDFSKRIPVTSDDEIGELSASFNMMTNSLAQLEGMRKSFVANVSHELKTPMTTIGGFIDGILDGTIEPEKQKYYLGIVSDEVKRLSRLVQSMLSMARLESGEFVLKRELFDFGELLCTIDISQEQRIEKSGINIIGLDELQNVSLNADKDLIHQAVYNLVDNAIKFTEDGGNIKFTLKKENKKMVFTVTNSGRGIPEKDLPFIFERFYKVDKSRSASKNSTGIGLYIVKTIVTSHGGMITVASKENEFTAFKVVMNIE